MPVCGNACLPCLPCGHIKLRPVCLRGPSADWQELGFLNVNVIQIYGRQIDGCGGYGKLDTVYVIEMHTDKNVRP